MNKYIYMAVKRICCILTIILSILSAQIKSYTKPEINKIFESVIKSESLGKIDLKSIISGSFSLIGKFYV